MEARNKEKFQKLNSTESHFEKKPTDGNQEKSRLNALDEEETEKVSGGAGNDL